MKVLHVTPYFYEAWAYGGIPRLSYHLAAAQAALGHEVHAVTTDARDRNSRRTGGDYQVSGISVRVHPNLSNLLAYHYQLFWPRGLATEAGRVGDCDVIHIHGHRNLLNTRMAEYARRAGKPIVLQPNGTLVNIERRRAAKNFYDALWGRDQVRRTTAFVAVSHVERDQFLKLGLAPGTIRVIPNGVEMDTRVDNRSFKHEFKISGEYVLYLGKITPRKGIEHAIAALPLFDDQGIKLVVAGNDMGFERGLRRRAERLGVADRVVFTGLVTGAMKALAYREALFTVYAGRDEIFGLVPWESILCGTPVIVADDSGCGEWVKAGQAGHLVPYGDPAAIARVINTRGRERDQAMVQQGIAFCRERLDWGRIAADMIEYYREFAR
ncbi:MAG TPA: glycosyltransferase [bacterium]|nr:glycosyltransferase [bacterium]